MSIEAHIEQIKEEEIAEKVRIADEQNKKSQNLENQRKRELPQFLAMQRILIEELDKIGILKSIEEFIGGEIPGLRPPEPPKPTPKMSEAELRARISQIDLSGLKFENRPRKAWLPNQLSKPSLSDEGVWDVSVRLKISENPDRYGFRNAISRWIDIVYDENRVFSAVGQDLITVNPFDFPEDQRLGVLERAVATVFNKPNQYSPKEVPFDRFSPFEFSLEAS